MLALNTATLGHNLDGHGAGWSPEQVVDACAEKGIGGITFWRREFTDNATQIGDRVRASNMQVTGLCRTPLLVGPGAPKDVIDDFKRAIDMAADLGADNLTSVVGGVADGSKGLKDSLKIVRDTVASMADHAQMAGVKVGIEPLHPVYAGNRSCLVSVKDAIDMVLDINHSAVGIDLDVYHIWWDQTLAEQLNRIKANQITGYHICDWLAETKDILLDRGMMGDGVADLKSIRQTVEATGFKGHCEVEIFSKHWWSLPPETVLDACIDRFKSYV